MHNFKMKQIALAVGASLLVMAGSSQAAVAPTARGVAPALQTTANAALLSATGLINTGISFDVTLTTGAAIVATPTANVAVVALVTVPSTAGLAVGMTVSGGGLAAAGTVTQVNSTTTFTMAVASAVTATPMTFTAAATAGGNVGTTGLGNVLTIGNATAALNNVLVYTGTAAAQVSVPLAGAFASLGAGSAGTSHITVNLPAPGVNAGYRITAGNLQYSANTNAAAPTWANVLVSVQDATAGTRLYTDMDNLAGFAAAATATAPADLPVAAAGIAIASVGNSYAPAPTISTTSVAGAALVNGFAIDFATPVTAPAATGLTVTSVAAGTITAGIAIPVTPGAVVGNVLPVTYATGATGIAGFSDAANYVSGNFNTGINAATVPFSVDAYKASFLTGSAITTAPTATAAGIVTVTAANTVAVGDRVNGAGLPAGTTVASATATAFTFAIPAASLYAAGAVTVDRPLSYTQVSDVATGNLAKVGSSLLGVVAGGVAAAFPAAGTITDGASPVVTSAVVTAPTVAATATTAAGGTTSLTLTFSEPMTTMGTFAGASDDLREIAENVNVGPNSLAALNLNAGGTLTVNAPVNAGFAAAFPVGTGTAAGTSSMTIGGVDAASVIVQANSAAVAAYTPVTVATGITFQEANDTNYKLGTNALDNVIGSVTNNAGGALIQLAGGIKSASLAVEAPSTAAAVTPAFNNNIAFSAPDATAAAITSATDATRIGSVKITFAPGKKVMLNPTSGATAAQLAQDIVINVTGITAGGNPTSFNVSPLTATVDAIGDITLVLPTALIYSKIATFNAMSVNYLNNVNGAALPGAVANVLTGLGSVAAPVAPAFNVVVAAGQAGIAVTIPLSARATNSRLYTQSLKGIVTGATSGSVVRAYLARNNTAVLGSQSNNNQYTIPVGGIGPIVLTNPADAAVSTNLVASISGPEEALFSTALLNSAYASNGVALNAPVPLFVQYTRSNTGAGASGTGAGGTFAAALTNATGNAVASVGAAMRVATTPTSASFNAVDPIYQLSFNRLTGAVTGAFTGTIAVKYDTINQYNNSGVQFLNPTTGLANISGTAFGTFGESQVDALGNYSLNIGVDTPVTNGGAVSDIAGSFILLVLEQPGVTAANRFKMLTSADNAATNYLPFTPDVLTAARLGVRAPVPTVAVANVKSSATVSTSSAWGLYALGDQSRKAGAAIDLPGTMVGLATGTGLPVSLWNNVTNSPTSTAASQGPMAFALSGNVFGIGTKLPTGDTVTTVGTTYVPGSIALAASVGTLAAGSFGVGYPAAVLQTLQNTVATAVTAPMGWSLVTVPAAGWTAATAPAAVIKVGAQNGGTNSYSWFTGDAGVPAVSVGEAVFVYKTVAGAL